MLHCFFILAIADEAATNAAVQSQKNAVTQAVNSSKSDADCATTCQNSSNFSTCKDTCLKNVQDALDNANSPSSKSSTNDAVIKGSDATSSTVQAGAAQLVCMLVLSLIM
eukprot:NODE_82_length_22708_cov_0.383476.p17 type:complete len:110 gc:universal NODE_82_length_22708_cov_0.383476:13854-13525(-)